MNLSTWDLRFLDLAEHIASWSKDPSTKCGAVIANDNRIVSLGFNGFARGVKDHDSRLQDREVRLLLTVHAEENALLFAGERAKGATLYIWPFPPCSLCAARAIQCGIGRVVAPVGSPALVARWQKSLLLSAEEFEDAKIRFDLVDFDYKRSL